jgi:hypothetical protein
MIKPLKLRDFGRASLKCMYLLGLAAAVVVFITGGARAQQTMELPMPGSQASSQPFVPRPQPTAPPLAPPSNNVQTIPSAPPPAPPEEPPQAEEPPPPPAAPEVRQPPPVLPAVFRGCWRGVVDETDRMERLAGAPRLGLWMPKTYMLCYRRVGDGPFQLTFTAAGVQGTRITNTAGQLHVVSTDGRSFAKMRAYLHFDEFRAPSWMGNSTFAVDEETDLNCTIEPDGMHALGVVYGERDGGPWFRAWWHTTFFHVANLSE